MMERPSKSGRQYQWGLGHDDILMKWAAALILAAMVPMPAKAQDYPSKPIHFIVGFAAGGGADIIARLLGQWLSDRLGQTVVVENRPGAATNIAVEAVARAPADGYTLMLIGSPQTINANLYRNLNYNFIRDIAPVGGISRVPNVLEVNLRSRSRPFRNSSPMPKPMRARSTWRLAGSARRLMSPANCSR